MLATTLATVATAAIAAVAAPAAEANRPPRQYTLHPNGDENKCLTIMANATISASLNILDCDKTNPNVWFALSPHGPTLIKGTDPKRCVGAGLTAYGWDKNYNGTYLYMDDCMYDADPCGNGQTWNFDGDKLVQTGSNQCVNSKPGRRDQPLTTTCDDANPDQVWTVSR